MKKSRRELAWEKHLFNSNQELKKYQHLTDSEIADLRKDHSLGKRYSFICAVDEKIKHDIFNVWSDKKIKKYLKNS